MLKRLRLALQFLWQEWRAREWLIIFFSLLLAITAITAFHFYIDRLMRGIDQESARLLGGDLVIESPTLLPLSWQQKATSLGLKTAEIWSFPSVVSTKTQLQLTNIQAVSQTYPLFGKKDLFIAQTIWVEPRLLSLLSIQIGDELSIGAARFRIAKVLDDTDTLNTGWTIAPRVLLRLEDVLATKTVLPGSRVDYRLLMRGDTKSLQAFRQWIMPLLNPGQRLLDVHQQRFIMQQPLYRAGLYLQLVLLVALAMSGVAIAISTQQYVRRHYSHVALWRCLGAKQSHIVSLFLWQFLIILCVAGIVGITMGYFLQSIFSTFFQDYFQFALPPPGMKPVLLGMMTSALLLFTFACPILIDLPRTPPLFLWRREIIKPTFSNQLYYIVAIFTLALFLYWMMQFSTLALLFMDIVLLSIGFLYAISLLFLRGVKRLLSYAPLAFKQGLNQLIHYPASISVQITSFSLILTLLFTLGMIHTGLITNWERSLPAHTPNYFAINIAVQDVPGLQTFFLQHHVPIASIYPMVRGRLIALNDRPIMKAVPASARDHNALHRELNLSFMLHYPSDNKITDGRAWNKQDENQALISVEKSLAIDLHLRLGDKLTFQIGNQKRSAVISNLRQVEWKSFHPNFYVIFPPGFLNHLPTTYITSFYLSPKQTPFLNEMIKIFPNLTIIDVAKLLHQVQTLIGKISMAIHILFLFSLAAGGLIFIASLEASLDERKETYALLRILGASKKYIFQSIVVEFTSLALIILVIAIVLAKFIVFLLDKMIFNF